MNQIIESFLQTHIDEYGISNLKKEVAFEHFVNRLIINKYSTDRFDPDDIMTDVGEVGLDGIAIIVNNLLVTDEDSFYEAIEVSSKVDIKFVFIQAKTSEKFDGDTIGTFCYGVKCFFLPDNERPETNEKIEALIRLKDLIYTKSIESAEAPALELYYVCCGVWSDGNNLKNRIDVECNTFMATQNFRSVTFNPYDNEKIIISYKELRKKVSKRFSMERRLSFPPMNGIKQAYTGLIKCSEFVNVLKDNDGKMLRNIFEDNVRDFQGYNPVNVEIQNTIKNASEQECFAILNNGVTLTAKRIEPIGDEIEVFDFQIVNGCQTSYVLFDNQDYIGQNTYILAKIIEVKDETVLDRIIYTTNRQTEVKSEAFISTKPFHKRLEDYYNSIEPQYRLFYERRSKQFDLADSVNKTKVITLSNQIYSYLSMFLNKPHSTHRYYGELLKSHDKQLFVEGSLYEPYYISAYFVHKINTAIKKGDIQTKYSKFKYHLVCAIRALAVGREILTMNNRRLKTHCNTLMEIIHNELEFEKLLRTAESSLDEALKMCPNIAYENRHRSKEVTDIMLDIVNEYSNAKNSIHYLKKGDIVTCVISSIKDYFVSVDIKTDDERNFGQIHISKIAKKYVEDINDELKLSQTVQAKIISDDFYESRYGWELTMIL